MHDTKTRRRKDDLNSAEKELIEQPSMDTMKGQYKINNIYLNLRNIKICLITVIGLILFYQLWRYSFRRSPAMEFPEGIKGPSPLKVEELGWRFKNHPQGLNEQSFSKLLNDLKTKDTCPSTILKGAKKDIFNLPKLDKLYESEGSLKFKDGKFTLDGKPFRILSGAMHYFRVLPEYWEDRMLKMKAMGLNTLETYVSWNLHEDKPGQFDFQGILDVRKYIELAQKVGLKVIFRPGPYICSEWDFGGLPAWLLKDPNMKVRSNYPGYLKAVDRFFEKLIPLVTDLQHVNGGPIIAVQIENEFGSYSSEVEHLLYLKKLLLRTGIKELLFVSDGQSGFGNAPFHNEALPTANFKEYEFGEAMFRSIRAISKDFPLVNTEFWSGWFDHWGKPHADSSALKMASDFCNMMKDGVSVNFYMVHGGTNFGFMAGSNWFEKGSYNPDITSYDYIAPLSEAGDITPKFEIAKTIIQRYAPDFIDSTQLQSLPDDGPKAVYGEIVENEYVKMIYKEGRLDMQSYLSLVDMVTPIPSASSTPVPMEMLDINKSGYGQNYGYILYRAYIPKAVTLKFSAPVQDRVQILVNGVEIKILDWTTKTWTVTLPQDKMVDENMLEILVENCGRVNYVHQGYNRFNEERKGISGAVLLDDKPIEKWVGVYPLEFKQDYINKVSNSHQWKTYANSEETIGLYKGSFTVSTVPMDTFISMKGWTKGIVIVNGFNLGRYWNIGPQRTLYLPAPILKRGENEVIVFEQHKSSHSVTFLDTHILE